MTKKIHMILAGLIGLTLIAGSALAQEDAAPKRERKGEPKRERKAGGDRGQRLGAKLKEAGLTAEDIGKVLPIVKAHGEKARARGKAGKGRHESLRRKMAAAKKANDTEAMAALKKQAGEGKAAHEEAMKEFKGKLVAAVGEEKAAKVLGAMKPKRRGNRGPKLTDEQKAKLKAAREAAKKIEDPKERREAMKNAFEEVLTDEQKAQMKERREAMKKGMEKRRAAMNKKLGITDEQEAKLKAAHEEAKKIEDPKERREAMKKAMDGILTDEQKEKMKEMRGTRGDRRGGRGKEGGKKRRGGRKGRGDKEDGAPAEGDED